MSDIWASFLKVNVGNVFSEHVLCSKCKAVLNLKSQNGTIGLKAHIKSSVRKIELPKITRLLVCKKVLATKREKP